jgi:hypothetical protein
MTAFIPAGPAGFPEDEPCRRQDADAEAHDFAHLGRGFRTASARTLVLPIPHCSAPSMSTTNATVPSATTAQTAPSASRRTSPSLRRDDSLLLSSRRQADVHRAAGRQRRRRG